MFGVRRGIRWATVWAFAWYGLGPALAEPPQVVVEEEVQATEVETTEATEVVADEPAEDVQAVDVAAGQQDFIRQQMERQFDNELKVAAALIALSEEAQKTLRKESKKVIKTATEKRAKANGAAAAYSFNGMEGVPKEVRTFLHGRLKTLVSKEKLKLYTDDVELRVGFQREVGVHGMLILLDGLVELRAEQRDKVTHILTAQWDPAWQGVALMASYGNRTGLPPSLPFEQLQPVFDKEQQKALEAAKKPNAQFFDLGFAINPNNDSDEQQREAAKKFKAQLDTAVAQKVSSLDAEFQLTASQKKKLQLLSKGVTADIVRLRKAALKRYLNAIQNNAGGIILDPNDVQLVQQPPKNLISRNDRWLKMVTKILKGDQRKRFHAGIEARKRSQRQALLGTMTAGMDQQMGLTGKQLYSFHKLMDESLPEMSGLGFDYRVFLALTKIPEEKLVAAIGEQHSQTLRSQLEASAKVYEQMEAARKAAEDADDEEDTESGDDEDVDSDE